MEQVYKNHNELLNSKRALHVAFGRLTLKAWDASPPSNSVAEPVFVTCLRSMQKVKHESRAERQESNATTFDTSTDTMSSTDPSPASDANALFGNLPGGMNFDIGKDFNFDAEDWMFWDQLIQDHQAQGGPQQGGFS